MPDDHSKIARLEEAKKLFYEELNDLKEDAKRREQKLDSIRTEIERSRTYRETICTNCIARLNDIEVRVRNLENSKFYWLGATGVIVFITSILGSALAKSLLS